MTLRRDNFLWQRDAVRHVLQVCSMQPTLEILSFVLTCHPVTLWSPLHSQTESLLNTKSLRSGASFLSGDHYSIFFTEDFPCRLFFIRLFLHQLQQDFSCIYTAAFSKWCPPGFPMCTAVQGFPSEMSQKIQSFYILKIQVDYLRTWMVRSSYPCPWRPNGKKTRPGILGFLLG